MKLQILLGPQVIVPLANTTKTSLPDVRQARTQSPGAPHGREVSDQGGMHSAGVFHSCPSPSSCPQSVKSDTTLNNEETDCPRTSFNEECTEYESSFGSLHECRILWYSREELHQFKKCNAAHALYLKRRHLKTRKSWFHVLESVQDNLRHATTEDDVDELLRSTDLSSFQVSFLGMEDFVLQSILCEKRRKKDVIFGQIKYWQNLQILDVSSQVEMLQKISEGVSRQSRLMALFIAKAMANASNL